ncbi:MAG: hypothetical protein AB7U45_12130 [Desulfamplus sp.]
MEYINFLQIEPAQCLLNNGKNSDSSAYRAYSINDLLSDAGNQQIQKSIRTGLVQTKLNANQAGDTEEQEADRIARQLVGILSVDVQNELVANELVVAATSTSTAAPLAVAIKNGKRPILKLIQGGLAAEATSISTSVSTSVVLRFLLRLLSRTIGTIGIILFIDSLGERDDYIRVQERTLPPPSPEDEIGWELYNRAIKGDKTAFANYLNHLNEYYKDTCSTASKSIVTSTPITKQSIIEGFNVSNHAFRKSGIGRGATEEMVSCVIQGAKKAGTVAIEPGTGKFAGNVIEVYSYNGVKVVVDTTQKKILSIRPIDNKKFKLQGYDYEL